MQPYESSIRSADRVPGGSAGRLNLDLFGGFRLRRGGQEVTGFEHPRLQHLLAYLALHRAAPISRQNLAYLFWTESTDQQALKNLRTLLTRLRLALPELNQLFEINPLTIQWRSDAPIQLDVAEFETAKAQAIAAQVTVAQVIAAQVITAQVIAAQVIAAQDVNGTRILIDALTTAISRYTGELLPGCCEVWILPLRQHYHQTCSEALERLIRLLEEHRQYQSALLYARRLLSHDPAKEAAYHHLIRLHLALGDRTEAVRVCQACDAMLEDEFGIPPARPTRFLYEPLLEREDQPGPAMVGRLTRESPW